LIAHVFEDTGKDKGFAIRIISLCPVRSLESHPHQLIDRGRKGAEKDEEHLRRHLGTGEI
jgi:hypothetical protein